MDLIEYEQQSAEALGLSESEEMNLKQQANFQLVARGVSGDTVFDSILDHISASPDNNHPLIWQSGRSAQATLPQPQETATVIETESSKASNRKRTRKARQIHKSDYQKNICGYITKRVIRQFIGNEYQREVGDLIGKHGSSIEECRAYYLKKVEFVTGPSHLPGLFALQPGEAASVEECKKVFREFYRWFLKHRYLRYLLKEGKMSNKQAYIQYKNTHLFKFLAEHEKQADRMCQASHSARKNILLAEVHKEQS